MQPVRKIVSATHFKPVRASTPPPGSSPSSAKMKWTPCSPGDSDAVEKSWNEIESDELQEPPLKLADFLKSLENIRPTVTESDIRRHDEWTKESGESTSLSSFFTSRSTTVFVLIVMVVWQAMTEHD